MSKPYKPKLRKGDQVKVIAGNAKDKTGTILSVDPKTRRAIVEKVNLQTRHPAKNRQEKDGNKQTTIVKKEGPIHLSKLMFIDPKTKEPTRLGRKIDTNGKLRRYAKKTGNFV